MKTRNIKCICGCDFHMIEVEETKTKNVVFYDILIYKHRSEKTGKLLKKPILLADVALTDDNYIKFKKFFKEQ